MPISRRFVLVHTAVPAAWVARQVRDRQVCGVYHASKVDVQRPVRWRRRVVHGSVVGRLLKSAFFRYAGDASVGHDMINAAVRAESHGLFEEGGLTRPAAHVEREEMVVLVARLSPYPCDELSACLSVHVADDHVRAVYGPLLEARSAEA